MLLSGVARVLDLHALDFNTSVPPLARSACFQCTRLKWPPKSMSLSPDVRKDRILRYVDAILLFVICGILLRQKANCQYSYKPSSREIV